MAKLPNYMKVEAMGKSAKGYKAKSPEGIYVNISVKWWGYLVLTYKCMKNYNLKWYHWLRYPEICWSVRRGFMRDNNGSTIR